MALTVKGHRILIKPDPVKEQVDVPDKLKELDFEIAAPGDITKMKEAGTQIGTVVGIGKTAWKAYDGNLPEWEPWCKVGDRVIFARYSGKFVDDPVTKERFFVINDDDIQVVVEGEKAPWE